MHLWASTFSDNHSRKPPLESLVEEYKKCKDKAEESLLTRKRVQEQKGRITIRNSLKDSSINREGERTSSAFRNRVEAAASLGGITSYSHEMRRLISFVAGEYS